MDGISAVGSIIGIVDIVCRALIKLYEIRHRITGTDLTLSSLIGELKASQLALQQTQDFIEENADTEQYFQVYLDLQATLVSCQSLMQFVYGKIESISINDGGTISFRSKVKLALVEKSTEEYMGKLHRQLNALGILIATLKCRDPEQQSQILLAQKNRDTLDEVKEDSTSLRALHDEASGATKRSMTTTATSNYLLFFCFDRILLGTGPYQKTFRSMSRCSAQTSLPHTAFAAMGPGPHLLVSSALPETALKPRSVPPGSTASPPVLLDDTSNEDESVKHFLVVGDVRALNTLWLQLLWPQTHPSKYSLVFLRESLCEWLLRCAKEILLKMCDPTLPPALVSRINPQSTLGSVNQRLSLLKLGCILMELAKELEKLSNEIELHQSLQNVFVNSIFSPRELSYLLQHVERMSDPRWIPEIDEVPLLGNYPQITRASTRAYFKIDHNKIKSNNQQPLSVTSFSSIAWRQMMTFEKQLVFVMDLRSYCYSRLTQELTLFHYCITHLELINAHDFILGLCNSTHIQVEKCPSIPSNPFFFGSYQTKPNSENEFFKSIRLKFFNTLEAAGRQDSDLHMLFFNEHDAEFNDKLSQCMERTQSLSRETSRSNSQASRGTTTSKDSGVDENESL